MKNSLNFVNTCLRVVDTRRVLRRSLFSPSLSDFASAAFNASAYLPIPTTPADIVSKTEQRSLIIFRHTWSSDLPKEGLC